MSSLSGLVYQASIALCALLLVPSTGVSQTVSPDYGAVSTPQFHDASYGHVVTFTVTNDGFSSQTYSLECVVDGVYVLTCSSPSSITLNVNESANIDVGYTTGPWGAGYVNLFAGIMGVQTDGGSYQVSVTSPPQPAILSTAPHNDQYLNPAGCANGCFNAVASYTTPAYVSRGVERSVTLLYNSALAKRMGVVQLDATSNSSTAASKISIQIKQNQTALTSEIFYVFGTGTSRLAAQFDASTFATGVHRVTAIVRAYWPDTVVQSSTDVLVLVLNPPKYLGTGWRIAGLQTLVLTNEASIVIDQGDGSLVRFTGYDCTTSCTYTSPLDPTKVSYSSSTGYIRRYPDSSRVGFDLAGKMLYYVNRLRDSTVYVYGTSITGETVISSIYDLMGKQTYFTYETEGGGWKLGTLRAIVTPGNRWSGFAVDANDDLRHLQDPNTSPLHWEMFYDASHRLTKRIDRRGGQWGFAYDFASTVSADTLPTIPVYGVGNARPVIQYASPISKVLVNLAGGSGTSTNPASRVYSSSYVGSVTDPTNLTTTISVNKFGLPLAVTNPRGKTTTYGYDGLLPNSITLADGDWQIFGYSGGRMILSEKKGERRLNYEYGSKGQLIRVYGYGTPTTYYYTHAANGLVDSVRIGQSSPVSMRYYYDTLTHVRLDSTKDARGHRARFDYESTWGNVNSTTVDGNRISTAKFDSYGRADSTRSSGRGWNWVTYDVLNRVTAARDSALPHGTTFSYDGSLLTRLKDPKLQVFKHEYNALGWMTKRYDAADTIRFEAFEYDIGGRPRKYTNRRGDSVLVNYDQWGRLISRTGIGVEGAYFQYDTLDRVRVDSNALARNEVIRNGKGWVDSLVTTLLVPNKRFRFHYTPDSLARVVSTAISNPGGITFPTRYYSWSAATGLLSGIGIDNEGTAFAYNEDRQLSGRTWPSGVGYSSTATAIHRPAAVEYTGSLVYAFSRRYGYDSLARIVEVQTLGSGVAFPTRYYYESQGQITAKRHGGQMSCPNPPDTINGYGYNCMTGGPDSTWFRYDSAGNRRDRSGQYGPGNRLTSMAGYTYETDLDGNITRKYWTANPGTLDIRYSWSPDGKLTRVIRSAQGAADTVEYRYAASGSLLQKKKNGTVVSYYLWESDQLFAELNGTATQRRSEYVYEPGIDRPLALITTRSNGTPLIRYFVRDEIGNVIGIVDSVKTQGSYALVRQTVEYDVWGKDSITYDVLPDTSRLFWKGLFREADGAGLLFVRSRWYDPEIARFISEDPIGIEGGDNLYAFGVNDPINNADPSGLSSDAPNFPCNHGRCGDDWFYGGDVTNDVEAGWPALLSWVFTAVRSLFTVSRVARVGATVAGAGASAMPVITRLNGETGKQMFHRSLEMVRQLPADQRAMAFRSLADQIAAQTSGAWGAHTVQATNGTMYVGAGHPWVLVFDRAGTFFTSTLNSGAFTQARGIFTVDYSRLTPR